MLTGALVDAESISGKGDMRSNMPRFQGERFIANATLVAELSIIAETRGCTPGQLSLAWLLAQGDYIAPIPGTKRLKYLEENAAAADLQLTAEDVDALDVLFAASNISGERYAPAGMRSLDRD
jgi:aryl-alcohol dehydrogenase-like predicted oxidoreductase